MKYLQHGKFFQICICLKKGSQHSRYVCHICFQAGGFEIRLYFKCAYLSETMSDSRVKMLCSFSLLANFHPQSPVQGGITPPFQAAVGLVFCAQAHSELFTSHAACVDCRRRCLHKIANRLPPSGAHPSVKHMSYQSAERHVLHSASIVGKNKTKQRAL